LIIKSFDTIKKEFEGSRYWGMCSQIDVHKCDKKLIKNEQEIKYYVSTLCNLIRMKPFGECIVVHFGEDPKIEGFSMFQLIETSSISGHFSNSSNNIFIDIFSCKPYDLKAAINFTSNFFKGTLYTYNLNFRK